MIFFCAIRFLQGVTSTKYFIGSNIWYFEITRCMLVCMLALVMRSHVDLMISIVASHVYDTCEVMYTVDGLTIHVTVWCV